MHELVAALYRQYAQELVTSLALSLNNRETAEDLAHEAFIQAMAKEKLLADHPNPRGWIFRTAYNLARDRRKRFWRRKHIVTKLYPILPADAWDEAIELRESLAALSPRQRDAIILHYYLGFSLEETASVLDCAPGTVKSHLARARGALGEALSNEGVS